MQDYRPFDNSYARLSPNQGATEHDAQSTPAAVDKASAIPNNAGGYPSASHVVITNVVQPPTQHPQKTFLDVLGEPRKIGRNALLTGLISLFIFGNGLSMLAIVYGILGLWKSVKAKSGITVKAMNVAAILVGFASRVLLEVFAPNR